MYRITQKMKKDIFTRVCDEVLTMMGRRYPKHTISITINYNGSNLARIRHKEEERSEITIGVDFTSSSKWRNYYEDRFGKFLRSLKLKTTDLTLFILALLHECGHLAFYDSSDEELFYTKMNYCKDAMAGIFEISRNSDNINQTRLRCTHFPDELSADRFAFENFMYIWDEI